MRMQPWDLVWIKHRDPYMTVTGASEDTACSYPSHPDGIECAGDRRANSRSDAVHHTRITAEDLYPELGIAPAAQREGDPQLISCFGVMRRG
jgi:hypothetical protein